MVANTRMSRIHKIKFIYLMFVWIEKVLQQILNKHEGSNLISMIVTKMTLKIQKQIINKLQ